MPRLTAIITTTQPIADAPLDDVSVDSGCDLWNREIARALKIDARGQCIECPFATCIKEEREETALRLTVGERAHVLRALAALGGTPLPAVAALLGFGRRAEEAAARGAA